jgi:hypothetical protein
MGTAELAADCIAFNADALRVYEWCERLKAIPRRIPLDHRFAGERPDDGDLLAG